MDERYGSGVVGFLGTWTQDLKGPWRNAGGQNRDLLAGRGGGVSWKTKADRLIRKFSEARYVDSWESSLLHRSKRELLSRFQPSHRLPSTPGCGLFSLWSNFPGAGACARFSQISSGLIVWEKQHRMS